MRSDACAGCANLRQTLCQILHYYWVCDGVRELVWYRVTLILSYHGECMSQFKADVLNVKVAIIPTCRLFGCLVK